MIATISLVTISNYVKLCNIIDYIPYDVHNHAVLKMSLRNNKYYATASFLIYLLLITYRAFLPLDYQFLRSR